MYYAVISTLILTPKTLIVENKNIVETIALSSVNTSVRIQVEFYAEFDICNSILWRNWTN